MTPRNIFLLNGCSVCLRRPAMLCLLLGLFLAGCARLPTDYPRTESTALEDYRSTSIGERWAEEEDKHPGESGFALLRYGKDAFSIRIAMIDLAEKTLDLQVYIWQADETGRILTKHLLKAADRGVKVRLLIDDHGFGGTDLGAAAMDAHPNVEVRLFNPFANRSLSQLDFIVDLDRVNHRMHNKIMVSDNSFAVVGGRNVGDYYFGVNPNTNFRDLDIMTVGPIVRDVSRVFDHFWQGDWAVPIAALVSRPVTLADLETGRERLIELIDEGSYPYRIDEQVEEFLERAKGRVVWAPGKVVWDDPQAIKQGEQVSNLIKALRRRNDLLEESVFVESAYFVIRESGVDNVREMVNRGIRVRVLTNSLASNDVLPAHAGHAKFRKGLVEAGAELYELRPDSTVIEKTWKGESRAGLHTKALVFDEETLFIGSFNLDPRSAHINTEAGIYVESRELSARLLEYMDEGVTPENSYRVLLDGDGNLVWVTEVDGEEVRYYKDPLSTWRQRAISGFIGLFPVESQL